MGYPVSASKSMIRQMANTNERVNFISTVLNLFCNRLMAEKLVSIKQIIVPGAIGIEFLPIPANVNALASHPVKAIILIVITIANAQTEISS